MFATPTALILTLPFALGIFTLLLPFASGPIKLPLVVLPVTVKLLNVPTLVIFGCALVVTVPAVPAVATFKLATCVVLVTTSGAVPVATVLIN